MLVNVSWGNECYPKPRPIPREKQCCQPTKSWKIDKRWVGNAGRFIGLMDVMIMLTSGTIISILAIFKFSSTEYPRLNLNVKKASFYFLYNYDGWLLPHFCCSPHKLFASSSSERNRSLCQKPLRRKPKSWLKNKWLITSF